MNEMNFKPEAIQPINFIGENQYPYQNQYLYQNQYPVNGTGMCIPQPNNMVMDPNTGLTMPVEQYLEHCLKQNELHHKAILESQKMQEEFRLRKELDDYKTANAIKREEGMEKRRRKRESASYRIFENPDGFFGMEVCYLDSEADYTGAVINCRHMRAHCVYELHGREMAVCIIDFQDSDGSVERVVLFGRFLNAEGLAKVLQKKGVTVQVGRDRKKLVWELIFSYLINTATKSELPDSLGWHKLEPDWFFTESEAQTIAGAKKGEYQYV